MVPIIAHPSEEYVKGWILGALLWALVQAVAQAQPAMPLIVGSLRDQSGAPISGARVQALDARGSTIASAQSGDDGTFALTAAAAAAVRVECDYCLPMTLHPDPAQPLAIVVHRFLAVMQREPSRSDIAALPYTHAESVLSLKPYTVLDESRSIVPGSYVSDRGLAAGGGLLLDGGIPVYDVTANQSPFISLPSRAAQTVSLNDAGFAFRYGDHADGGIAGFDTQNQNRNALAIVGSDRILQAGSSSPNFSSGGFFSNDEFETRQRFNSTLNLFSGTTSFGATILTERGSFAPDQFSNLASSFSALRLSAERTQAQRLYGQLILDRGSYGANFSGSETSADWNDINARAGVESISAAPIFLEASFHRASGVWSAPAPLPTIDGSLTQTQLSAGITSHSTQSDFLAGVSAFGIAYNGGPTQFDYAVNTSPAATSLVTPSLDYRWHAGSHWSLDSVIASTFRLPTFLGRYGMAPVADVVSYDRNALFQETIEYTDLSRVRASLTAYRERTNGLDNGVVSGAGASLAWGLSAHWSLRTWFLRDTDTTVQAMPYVQTASPVPVASVGSIWLTYENESYVRADLIFRRDLVDDVGFNHFDGSLFVPIGANSHLFIGSEVRQKRRSFDFGLRFDR